MEDYSKFVVDMRKEMVRKEIETQAKKKKRRANILNVKELCPNCNTEIVYCTQLFHHLKVLKL